jgi:hypothetical protein
MGSNYRWISMVGNIVINLDMGIGLQQGCVGKRQERGCI